MPLDPLETTQSVVGKYIDYLTTTFSLNDPVLQTQLEKELSKTNKFSKGPIIEATPPFVKGKTLRELINEGLLSKEFLKFHSDVFPLDRPLYKHQEIAIRKIIGKKRNLIVATGTGSGKTETFLIPILNHLLRQKEKGNLTPGVRALLLYPMNALANDQLKRLRKILKPYPDITFGSYTGETEERTKYAIDKYKKINNGKEPLKNELVSREQMKNTPPHILLTNYAMLEYLMLRPQDHVFFDGEYANYWKFIVIDEVHTYSGAKGIEMAMLLRRLKERVVKSQKNILRCIATSATLGGGEKDFSKIAEFGEKLFDEKFEWSKNSPERQDVISAIKMELGVTEKIWGKPDPKLYIKLQKNIEENNIKSIKINDLSILAQKHNVPYQIIREAESKVKDNQWQKFLYEILKGDQRVITLQKMLQEDSRDFKEVSKIIFKDMREPEKYLVSLVFLANKAKPGEEAQPLIPARYHLFVRAIEGAYITLYPEKTLFLERRKSVNKNGKHYPVFEIATCRQCDSVYLVGEVKSENGRKVLKQSSNNYLEINSGLEYFLLKNKDIQPIPDNEDEIIKGGEEGTGEVYKICGICGTIDKANLIGKFCECQNPKLFELIKVKSKDGLVHKCPACGSVNTQGSIVWRFLLGGEAVTSVLATSLYQKLPEIKHSKGEPGEESKNEEENNTWGTLRKSFKKDKDPSITDEGSRQLLIFSDSRQDAAFYATYLDNTYSQILRRRLILKTLEKYKNKAITNKWRLVDLVNSIKNYIQEANIFPEKSPQQIENEAWKWVLYEFLAIDRRNSLEGLGCLGFSLVKPEDFIMQGPLKNDPWNLNDDEIWLLFQILLDSFRKNGAVLFPENIDPKDDFFKPRNSEYFFKQKHSIKGEVYSWSPTSKGILNSRLDFLLRLCKYGLRKDISYEDCEKMLDDIWTCGLSLDKASIFSEYFSSINVPGKGSMYRIKTDFWGIKPGIIDESIKWYFCSKCNRITLFNLKGVCPTYRCSGKLIECDPSKLFAKNHYRNLYLGVIPLKMKVSEHTAQLTTEAAAEIQQKFSQGQINVLSCSTTFELGVDVGELESVFMRNVPPTAANYIQRAGRAGRRTDSTAFALTFAQRRPHDLANFKNPKRMVNGIVNPPYFELKNEKIVRRHIYATALSRFWKKYKDYFGKVEDFFFHPNIDGVKLFKEYLESRPLGLKTEVERIAPKDLHDNLGVKNWGWINGLFNEKIGVMHKAYQELKSDVTQLEYIRDQYKKDNNKLNRAYVIQKTINTIKKRYLINFMAQRNILPKYGFPVDVVDLQIYHHGDAAKQLDLSRDLQIALSEYAPGSQVVAGGKLWTSRYLKKLPEREWIKYSYAICDNCGYYHSEIAEKGLNLETCRACGTEIGRKKGVFVIPEFGFISEKPQKPGMIKPERTFSTRKYYVGEAETDKNLEMNFGEIKVKLISAVDGKLAVINHAGLREFLICPVCGYAVINDGKYKNSHKTPWKITCNGRMQKLALGYEFNTDILQVIFEYYEDRKGFWESLLYGLLEGASQALGIERQDIDGCLYPYSGDPAKPALILFDDVPGGAGHVKRLADKNVLKAVLKETLKVVDSCSCGGKEGETSCYGCLRNYSNQYCHDILNRSLVVEFCKKLLDTHLY